MFIDGTVNDTQSFEVTCCMTMIVAGLLQIKRQSYLSLINSLQ